MREDIKAWLGPAVDELTDEQIELVAREAQKIAARFPDRDEEQERQDALNSYVQQLLGEV